MSDDAATVREPLLMLVEVLDDESCADVHAALAALDRLEAERDDYKEKASRYADDARYWSNLYSESTAVKARLMLIARAEAAEAERDEARRELLFVGEVNKALMPYQERAVAAEAEAARLREALRHIEAQPDSPGAAAYMRVTARAALRDTP